MGKEGTKKQAPAPSHAKKGSVIERRRNRTVDQDHARGNPKWENVGGGVLKRIGREQHGPHGNPIRLEGGGFRSVSYTKPQPAVEATYVRVGEEVPPAPPTGQLPTFKE